MTQNMSTAKVKMWQNSKNQIVTKLKSSNCGKTQTIKLWQNPKTQIVTVVIVAVVTVAVVTNVIVVYFSKNNLTPGKPMRFLRAAFRDLAMFDLSTAVFVQH